MCGHAASSSIRLQLEGLCLQQVYSTELVTTLGSACSRLLDGLAEHLSRPRPHATGGDDALQSASLAARTLFILLQNPLNADASGIGTPCTLHSWHFVWCLSIHMGMFTHSFVAKAMSVKMGVVASAHQLRVGYGQQPVTLCCCKFLLAIVPPPRETEENPRRQLRRRWRGGALELRAGDAQGHSWSHSCARAPRS